MEEKVEVVQEVQTDVNEVHEEIKEPVENVQVEKEEEKEIPKEKEKPKTRKSKVASEELAMANKTVAELTEQLKAHQEQLNNTNNTYNELSTAYAKAENKVKEYEELLTKMVEDKIKNIPSEYAELIPSHMSITQQLEWLVKAESKNLFNKSNKNLDVEIGKPMGATVNTKANIKDMSSTSLLSMAYNVIKK